MIENTADFFKKMALGPKNATADPNGPTSLQYQSQIIMHVLDTAARGMREHKRQIYWGQA